MKEVTNLSEEIRNENVTPEAVKKNLSKYDFSEIKDLHDAKIAINTLMKKFEELQIPVFIAMYAGEDNKENYIYDAVLPEEIGTEKCQSQYGKFLKFMQIVIDFNKEDYMPYIKIGE